MRRELLKPEYAEQDFAGRLYRWLVEVLSRGVGAASESTPLTFVFSLAIFLALVLALLFLLTRPRWSAQTHEQRATVFGEEQLSAAEFRRRAQEALAAHRYDDAVLDAFRALALRQIEFGIIEGQPGATAHELSTALVETFVDKAGQLRSTGQLFDLVAYGHRAATHEQAVSVLTLDDALVGVR